MTPVKSGDLLKALFIILWVFGVVLVMWQFICSGLFVRSLK
jgi:hypothetical protein